jgi:hypothetical protein
MFKMLMLRKVADDAIRLLPVRAVHRLVRGVIGPRCRTRLRFAACIGLAGLVQTITRQTGFALRWAVVGLAAVVWPASAAEQSERPAKASRAEIHEAATRAVRLIERTSAEYLGVRNCFTCHTQTLSTIVLSDARKVGIAIDEQNFRRQIERVAELSGSLNGLRIDTVGYGLWTLDLGRHVADEMTSRMTAYLLKYGRDLGHWEVTVNRPPAEASHFTTNYVAIRGLKRYGTADQAKEIEARTAAVRRWIGTAKAGDTEDEVFRLRLAREIDVAPEELETFVRALLKQQQESGGWPQKSGMHADAYATGSALVALHEAGGIPCDDPAWRRGLAYLLETQARDGSWHVATRAKPIQEYFESGFPYGKDQFISAFATGWAADALLISLRAENEE